MAKAQKNAATITKATTKTKAAAAAAKTTNGFTNPFRENGGYWCSVEALRSLGIDTLHPFESIIPAVKKAFGLNWSEFVKKDQRNENGKDAEQRIITNVAVIARKDTASASYGRPLRELGYEVRFDGRQKVAGLFKIKAIAPVAKEAAPITSQTNGKTPKVGKAAPKAKTPQKAAGKAAKKAAAKAK